MKKRVCKTCKMFVEGEICPHCKKDSFAVSFQGRINFVDAKKSFIASQMGVEDDGEYAIKVR